MSTTQPHLERRPTGYYWRRRIPARVSARFSVTFLCFPLHTNIPRDAAERARRLTALSELCFNAETQVHPEVMTSLLTEYARLEIETADRLRALTSPRTREAAEAAMSIEAAARAALRDAIFLCNRTPAVTPIRDTARHLGIEIDDNEEDYAILVDRMLRLMIELSEERERRARGVFADRQPYLDLAFQSSRQRPPSSLAEEHVTPPSDRHMPQAAPAPETGPAERQTEDVIHQDTEMTISYAALGPDDREEAPGNTPTILSLWDGWFDACSRGATVSGAYAYEDKGAADRFARDADTIRATRKLIGDILGDRRIDELTDVDWKHYNDTLFRIPANHGKSSADRDRTITEIIATADAKETRETRRARHRIESENLEGDAADALLAGAKVKRISPRTFQRHQKRLSTVLEYGVEQGLIPRNPFKPFVLGEKAIDRLRQSKPDTGRLLWGKEFADMLKTDKWRSEKTKIDDHVYWVPLIARLHGMRSEEILQLKPSDIRSDNGIAYFNIRMGTGQSLKSDNARRMIPLHSQLIELGFLELVERQKELKRDRLFCRVTRSKSKKLSYTVNFSKNFTYYRKSRGCYEQRRDLHALRTTFNSKLVARAVPDTARRYLMGHKNADIGITNYLPEGFPLATLKEYIEQDQLDLSMVTRRFGKAADRARGPRLATSGGIKLSA